MRPHKIAEGARSAQRRAAAGNEQGNLSIRDRLAFAIAGVLVRQHGRPIARRRRRHGSLSCKAGPGVKTKARGHSQCDALSFAFIRGLLITTPAPPVGRAAVRPRPRMPSHTLVAAALATREQGADGHHQMNRGVKYLIANSPPGHEDISVISQNLSILSSVTPNSLALRWRRKRVLEAVPLPPDVVRRYNIP